MLYETIRTQRKAHIGEPWRRFAAGWIGRVGPQRRILYLENTGIGDGELAVIFDILMADGSFNTLLYLYLCNTAVTNVSMMSIHLPPKLIFIDAGLTHVTDGAVILLRTERPSLIIRHSRLN
jgi:hypothetical protein